MKFDIAQATGLNTDQEAALVLSVPHDQNNIFLAILKIVSDDAFTKGRQILSEGSDIYFDSQDQIGKRLTEVYEQTSAKLEEVESYDLVLAVISGKVLYLISKGQNAVFLKRGGSISTLTTVAQTGQLISGFLQEQDRLFFATDSLVTLLGEDVSKSLKLGLSDWEEETNMKITTVNLDYQGLAGLIVDVEADEAIKEERLEGIEPMLSLDDLPTATVLKLPRFDIKDLVSKLFSRAKLRNRTHPSDEYTAFAQPTKRKIHIPKFIPSSGKSRILLGVILLLIVIGGVGVQYKKSQDEEKNKAFSQLLQQSKDNFTTASGLQNLNPEETKAKLSLATELLEKAIVLKPDNIEALDLRKKMNEESSKILQQFAASQADIFLDLDLIKKGFQSNYMSLAGTNLLTLDPNTNTLVVIDISKKSNKILSGQEKLGNATLASVNGNFAFAVSVDKGVTKVDITNQKTTIVAGKDNVMSGVVDISGFANNVYLLDKDSNQIWKYLPTDSGYSDKREYFSKGVKADLANAVRMQIESSVFILKSGGEILRFTKGAADDFSLTGLDQALKDPKSMFTSSDVDNLYILDSGNSRMVVADKNGVFKSQYQGDKFGVASDLVVDEIGKKVYLLDNGKIFVTELK